MFGVGAGTMSSCTGSSINQCVQVVGVYYDPVESTGYYKVCMVMLTKGAKALTALRVVVDRSEILGELIGGRVASSLFLTVSTLVISLSIPVTLTLWIAAERDLGSLCCQNTTKGCLGC